MDRNSREIRCRLLIRPDQSPVLSTIREIRTGITYPIIREKYHTAHLSHETRGEFIFHPTRPKPGPHTTGIQSHIKTKISCQNQSNLSKIELLHVFCINSRDKCSGPYTSQFKPRHGIHEQVTAAVVRDVSGTSLRRPCPKWSTQSPPARSCKPRRTNLEPPRHTKSRHYLRRHCTDAALGGYAQATSQQSYHQYNPSPRLLKEAFPRRSRAGNLSSSRATMIGHHVPPDQSQERSPMVQQNRRSLSGSLSHRT